MTTRPVGCYLMLVTFAVTACNGDDELDALKSEVAELRETLATANTQIASLQSQVDALTGGVNLATLRTDVDALQTDVSAQDTRLGTVETTVSTDHSTRLTALETKTAAMRALPGDDTDNPDGQAAVVFEGVNVYIWNGTGSTEGIACSVTEQPCPADNVLGLGNLIVGYNEAVSTWPRTGSHNLVVGRDHTYTSFGGFVAGESNAISGEYSSVVGGAGNTASGNQSAVLGGEGCEAAGFISTVYGGDSDGSPVCQDISPF